MSAEIGAAPCWVITTGEAGMMSQALGVASAVGLDYEHKLASIPAPWSWLPGYVTLGLFSKARLNGVRPRPPWPELLITCGRRPAIFSVAIKRASGGRTVTVHIQDPKISPRHFDLVVPPRHDRMSGPNVLSTRGAVHLVTQDRLEKGRAVVADRLPETTTPILGVLLGGSSNSHTGDAGSFARIGAQVAEALRQTGGTAWVTPSRRTDPDALQAFKKELGDLPYWIWDGQGENPYFGLLSVSDYIIVTSDSVSMVTEACSTGKPVYIASLPGGVGRFDRFHQDMREEGATRPFSGVIQPPWSYEAVNDTPKVASAIRGILASRNCG